MFYFIALSIIITTAVRAIDDGVESLSSFAAYTYNLLKSAGVFDKLFKVSFIPGEAAQVFMKSGLDFPAHLGFKNIEILPFDVSNAAVITFKRNTTPLELYKIYANSMEHYLNDKGILTPDNVESMAQKYFDVIMKELDSFGTPTDSASKVDLWTKIDANYVSSFGQVSEDHVRSMMKKFISELKKKYKEKKTLIS